MKNDKLHMYKRSISIALNQMFWDINPSFKKSKKKLGEIREKYKGEKAVILCNGPSLRAVNFEKLNKSSAFVIGLNKINLLMSEIDIRLDALVCVNRHVLMQNQDFFNNTDVDIFCDKSAWLRDIKNPKMTYLNSLPLKGEFSHDLTKYIFQGYTVTYVALQLALHLGFDNVALVGCDHYFKAKGDPNKAVIASGPDLSHFSENYFAEGQTWQLPDLEGSELHYFLAKQIYESQGKKIFNATDGGALEIFRRISFNEFLSMS